MADSGPLDRGVQHPLQNHREPILRDDIRRSLRLSEERVGSYDRQYNYICRDNDKWASELVSIQTLCDKQDPVPEIQVTFLPRMADVKRLGGHDQLSDRFKIPPVFWSSVSLDTNGYYSCQDTRDANRMLESFSSCFCFLVKDPVKHDLQPSLINNIKTSYVWHKLGFYTIWTPIKGLVVLCFGLPLSFKKSLLDFDHLHLDDPFSFHAILIDKVITLYDTSLWSWRDLVRDIEKNRVSLENPQPDYSAMHDLARHTIHSSETLAIAVETVTRVIQEHEIFFNENTLLPMMSIMLSKQTRRTFRSQVALLKSLYLRSKALEERLRNEINLAFNTVAQHDSRIAVQIGKATQVDSAAMKTISVLGLVFLPGTFTCALFSTSFFNFSPGNSIELQRWTISDKFWIYWAVTIPVTVATVALWFLSQRHYGKLLTWR